MKSVSLLLALACLTFLGSHAWSSGNGLPEARDTYSRRMYSAETQLMKAKGEYALSVQSAKQVLLNAHRAEIARLTRAGRQADANRIKLEMEKFDELTEFRPSTKLIRIPDLDTYLKGRTFRWLGSAMTTDHGTIRFLEDGKVELGGKLTTWKSLRQTSWSVSNTWPVLQVKGKDLFVIAAHTRGDDLVLRCQWSNKPGIISVELMEVHPEK